MASELAAPRHALATVVARCGKCYCGNPLTPPELLITPTYVGPLWSGFDPGHITIINQSTTITARGAQSPLWLKESTTDPGGRGRA